MPTPPDQNIPPLRKVKPLRVTLAVPLTAHVPGVCDIGGLVLQRLGDARLAELMAEMNRTSDHWYRARVLFGGEAEQFWWKRFGEAAQRANIDNLNHFTKALDVLGAGATAVGAYARSAKDSMVGRFWDAAAGGVVDYAMGSSGLAIGPQFTGLKGGAAVAAADTVVELAIPGGGLSSLFMGTLQAAPVLATDPARFHAESSKGTYGLHMRVASATGDYLQGDTRGYASFQEASVKGEHGMLGAYSGIGGLIAGESKSILDYHEAASRGDAGVVANLAVGFGDLLVCGPNNLWRGVWGD